MKLPESSASQAVQKLRRVKARTAATVAPVVKLVRIVARIMTALWPKGMMKQLMAVIRAHPRESLLVAGLLIVSIIAHAWNMFHFPYYENDEATYVSRAWTFVHEGELDVYTYRYDHAPVGWILLGLWQLVTGGAFFFGSLLESGRVFMLLLHAVSTMLVYILAKRFSGGSKLAGTIAVLFFALSPIAIYFQRRILLDNIMTFWLLVSLYFATQPVQRLKYFIVSGLTFGLAVLTKLNAVFLMPAVLFIVWIRAHKRHRLHASAYWLMVTGIVISSFFVYALLKGELFPAPLSPDGKPTHVSVVETFALQLGRGDFAWPWEATSSFIQNIKSWLLKDWSILAFGAGATMLIAVIGIWWRKKQPYILVLAVLVLLYVAFLARGKIVLDLYIVPLIPLFAMAIGVLAGVVHRHWLRKQLFKDAFLLLLAGCIAWLFVTLPTRQYRYDETSNQIAVADWVKKHVPEDAIIATDNYLYPYLAQEGAYKNVSYFFSTEYDPEIRRLYDDDWRNVEYLVLTHEIVKQIKSGTVPRIKQIFDHAVLVADYRKGASSYIDLPNYISTNGDWAQVYKIKNRNDIVMQDSWQYFKSTFIVDYGQVIDLSNGSLSTSGSQAQAMLRAVNEDDQAMFGGLWQWSKDHLRYRVDDKLLSWKWERQPDGTYALGDTNTVCDADQLIAHALYKADEKWPGKKYGAEAAVHLQDWLRQCTFERGGKYFIDSSADGSNDIRLLNTGYFRPALYRYFDDKLPSPQWQALIHDGYELLGRMHAQYGTIPDWTVMAVNGSLQPATPLVGADAHTFGYDALQLVPSIAEDYILSKDPLAQSALTALQPLTEQFVATTKSFPATSALILASQALPTSNQAHSTPQRDYEKYIYKGYRPTKGYWGDGKNYRDQVWLWQWHYVQPLLPESQQVSLK